MITDMNGLRLAVGWITLALPIHAQSPMTIQKPRTREQIAEIRRNTHRLRVSVKVDRDIYFPGEEATINVSVENPTSQMLEVIEPFRSDTGSLELMARIPSKTARPEWMYL